MCAQALAQAGVGGETPELNSAICYVIVCHHWWDAPVLLGLKYLLAWQSTCGKPQLSMQIQLHSGFPDLLKLQLLQSSNQQ